MGNNLHVNFLPNADVLPPGHGRAAGVDVVGFMPVGRDNLLGFFVFSYGLVGHCQPGLIVIVTGVERFQLPSMLIKAGKITAEEYLESLCNNL